MELEDNLSKFNHKKMVTALKKMIQYLSLDKLLRELTRQHKRMNNQMLTILKLSTVKVQSGTN